MDSAAFVEAYQDLNHHFITLANDLSALRGLSQLDMRQARLEGLVQDALRVLLKSGDFQRCSVYLLEDATLRWVGGLDWRDLLGGRASRAPQPQSFRLGEGILGLAAETGTLQHCRDCRAEPHFAQRDLTGKIGSLICAPMPFADKVLGAINVSHPRPNAFSESHERLLTVFAGFLGQMLANWRYYHQLEESIRHRTHELASALAEAEELKHRYQHLSVIDELTGIHNRRFFFPEAHTALAGALRYRQAFSIMMVDLDHFKRVNDQYGHGMGDKVLQVTAALLKGQTREGDVLARFGGEEFALALPNTDLDGTRQLADRVLGCLRTLSFNSGGQSLQITASIGISALTEDESSDHAEMLETLLRQADQALYFSKTHGRDQYRAHADPELHAP
ncbi:MAG: diguanylate cyclase [Gammaproteobacteria bacterium]